MLYEFHQSQNKNRPGSVYATYLVYGTLKPEQLQGDGDIEMTSSMPESEAEPLSEQVYTSTLTLAPEDKLQGPDRFTPPAIREQF